MALTEAEKKKIDEEEAYRAEVARKYSKSSNDLKKTTAGLLAIFIGGAGIHKFYLGKIGVGILYLLFSWTFLPAIIGLIEGIIYLTMSDADFNKKYNSSNKGGGRKRVIIALAACVVLLVLLPILSTIILVAINPVQQLQKARNVKRKADVNIIMNALQMYKVNYGSYPTSIDTIDKEISSTDADICNLLVPDFIQALPVDPKIDEGRAISAPCPETYSTGYHIVLDTTGSQITVSAPDAELSETIAVTR